MKVLIIEDENLAVERLTRLLRTTDPEIEILESISTVTGSVKWLSAHTCDLIFLDIHLADGLSFGIFEQVQVDVPIIFTTAYDQYAIKAFQVNSIDYLLKPFNQKELEKSLQKYTSIFGHKTTAHIDFHSLVEMIQNREPYQKRFVVHAGQKIKSIAVEDIAYFFADEKMVFLCTFDARNYIIDYTIDKLEAGLDQDVFFRINRRFIINIKSIAEMYSYPKSRVKLELSPRCDQETIVSIERSTRFKQWLNR